MTVTSTVRVILESNQTTVISSGTIGPPGPPGTNGSIGSPGSPGEDGAPGFGQAVFGMDGELVVTIGAGRLRIVGDHDCSGVIASVKDPPVGSTIIIDANKNGTTIFTGGTNRPTIADGDNDSDVEVPDIISFVDGDILTIDVDDVGSTFPGADLTVQVIFQ